MTEKGYLTLELSVEGQAGHSSIPPAESPIGVLAAAVARLEQHPHPSFLERGVETDFFAYLAPHVSCLRLPRCEFEPFLGSHLVQLYST